MTVDNANVDAAGVGLDTAVGLDTGPDAGVPVPKQRSTMSVVAFGGLASLAAGAVHASAAGIHAEHPQLARIFIVTAVLQIGAGLWALLRPSGVAALGLVAVNGAAVVGWLATRLIEISWIDGLEVREAAQFADTATAILGVIAIVAAYTGVILPADRRRRTGLPAPSVLIVALAVWTMMAASTHVHSHDDAGHSAEVAGSAHDHGEDIVDGGAPAAVTATDDHTATGHTGIDHTGTDSGGDAGAATSDGHDHGTGAAAAPAWPRPWNPTQPIDVSGVAGVSVEQELRAVTLIEGTLRELPKYADPADAIAAGYSSIGDAGTGSEHYIKGDLIGDDVLLDPTAPESLVYAVSGDQRTLAGAMYIAGARPADDPTLTDWAGPLMTWHKHDNLCWSLDSGKAKVVGIVDAGGNCANGIRAGGENPMVHVWIQPHPCGVFAALEGIGAGTAAVSEDQRMDMCGAGHDHGGGSSAEATDASAVAKPYDPTLPIDLSGTLGVTPQQQAAAENLIAVTLVRLPQWSDYKTAEAAGFRSIGDAGTGHEHFIQWDWINDDTILDPDHPESLVFEPQPDGSKKLVSAMYMLPDDVALADVPDIGGALMQWHIHDNLCFTSDPAQPRVGGLTNAAGNCQAGLTKFRPAAMIHVWITPHPCGPFAALEGVGAGQIVPGEERLCDHQHGGGF